MPNVFNRLAQPTAIFRNADALSPEFLPESLPGREAQESELALALKPAAEGGRPANCFIFGPSGTGKTSTCRKVLAQLQEYSGRAFCFYANCWQYETEQAVLSALALKLGAGLPRRGLATDEIFERINQFLKVKKSVPVVVLDEADRLFYGGEQKLLYRFSRSGEQGGAHFATVMVTNDAELMAKADQRIRSSLSAKQIEFEAYSPTQLKSILQYRAQMSLAPGAYGDEVIALCAAHGAKNGGDARTALQALWLAAKQAEGSSAQRITLEHVKKAMGSAAPSAQQKLERDEQALDARLKAMLEIIQSNPEGIEVGKLYTQYEDKHGGGERTLRNYLRELEFKKLVKTEPTQGGFKIAKAV